MSTPCLTEPRDSRQVRRAYGRFPTGVVAVCALDGDQPAGMLASSFTSVSLDPPLASVSMQHTSTTWPRLARRPRLGVSVMAAGQREICARLAARGADRFAGVRWSVTRGGAVLIDDAATWLECSVHDTVAAGDHDVILLRVRAGAIDPAAEPLVFHDSGYRLLASRPMTTPQQQSG
jgi:flavin reductase (DIM6/NTAB) family NADH-FMN oxidoreductase RutF